MEEKKCEFCGDPVKLLEWEMTMEQKYGWWTHFVDGAKEILINAHTHNMERKYNHPDLQVVLPLDPKIINGIFWAVAKRIEAGEKFKSGDVVEQIVQDFKVKLALADEGGRKVLRIVLPDPNGKLEREEQEEQYAWQWLDTL